MNFHNEHKMCFKSLPNKTQMKLRSLRAAVQSGNILMSNSSCERHSNQFKVKREIKAPEPSLGRPLLASGNRVTQTDLKEMGWGELLSTSTCDFCPFVQSTQATAVFSYYLVHCNGVGTRLKTTQIISSFTLHNNRRQMLTLLFPFWR